MIDPSTEKAISLNEAGRRLPPGRNGAKPWLPTLLRWIHQGCKGPGGKTIKLRAGRCGGKWFTSEEALREFVEALTPRLDSEPAPSRTPTARRRAIEQADRVCDQAGV